MPYGFVITGINELPLIRKKQAMSQSIDFHINDFINEYLDFKGFNQTSDLFFREREQRQEPVQARTNGNGHHEQEKSQTIQVVHSR